MNEAETRAELIDPKLRANGWGVVEDSKILRERNVCKITYSLACATPSLTANLSLFASTTASLMPL
jgi:type I site-specific restriction endonuclease